MSTPPSPIEMMVDQASGFDPTQPSTETVSKTAEELAEASILLLKVADAAKKWWEQRRPKRWTEKLHLQSPYYTDHLPSATANMDLCKAVADLIKIGG